MPGGRTAPIPGLLSVELPPGIQKGVRYRLVVHQLSGAKLRVIGTFQLEVPVFHEPELLESESIKLSLLRWVFTRIPTTDPWRPVFERYLGEIADRVRGFGSDPDQIEPSPRGDGFPGAQPAPGDVLEGKIVEVRYDCFGDFTGFVLASCDARYEFDACEQGLEKLVLRACAERFRLRVRVRPENHRRVAQITVHCC